MRITKLTLRFLGFSLVCSVLLSCERVWYLDFMDTSNIGNPTLCISTKPHCAGEPVDLSILAIDEIDRSGKFIRKMWVIQTTSNSPLKVLKYGETPAGWKVIQAPIALEPEKIYRVEDHVFTCNQTKEKNVCKVIE